MAPKKSGSGGDLLDIEKQVRFVLQAQQGGSTSSKMSDEVDGDGANGPSFLCDPESLLYPSKPPILLHPPSRVVMRALCAPSQSLSSSFSSPPPHTYTHPPTDIK